MKNVLITGASSGLGRDCALHLASKGFRVFAGVRREEDGESVRGDAAGELFPLILDVTLDSTIAEAQEICAKAGGLYGLVNNAGITVAGPIELLPLDAVREQFEVNVLGQLAVVRAFLSQLRASRGRIVLMGSILGKLALPFLAPYCASKFALDAIADSLAIELRKWGISLSLLEPGNIATPIWTRTIRRAEETLAETSEAGWELYRPDLDSFRHYAEKATSSGISAGHVSVAVERALSARRPRPRYTVGWDSRVLGTMARMVPARLRQWLVRRVVLRR